MFAGAGVKGGRVLGRTDAEGAKCLETGWASKEQPRIENVVATMYSALGIDWTKEIRNTPSGRTYVYVDPWARTASFPRMRSRQFTGRKERRPRQRTHNDLLRNQTGNSL